MSLEDTTLTFILVGETDTHLIITTQSRLAYHQVVRWILILTCATIAFAGTDPKPKPEDYPVSGESNGVGVGSEFMIHSFSGENRTFILADYLVVEVAVYPAKDHPIDVNNGQFSLRLNGKTLLRPQAPQMVAASIHHPDWSSPPHAEAGGGAGNAGVILGRPIPPADDPQAPGRRTPPPIQVPRDDPSGVEGPLAVNSEQLAVSTALTEGESRGPRSGYLYFSYRGKTKSIKSLELLYGDAVLKLR